MPVCGVGGGGKKSQEFLGRGKAWKHINMHVRSENAISLLNQFKNKFKVIHETKGGQ